MDNKIQYKKLRLSIYDNSVPAGSAKIHINTEKKIKGNAFTYNGLKLQYCELGICSSEKKPCNLYSIGCPYCITKKIEEPRKNSKQYKEYRDEFALQMISRTFNGFIDEQVEKAIYNELDKKEYEIVIVRLANSISSYAIQGYCHLHKIFKDIDNFQKTEVKRESKRENEERIIFDIGDFFYIDILNLPDDLCDQNDDIVWYNYSNKWIKKEKFTKLIWDRIKSHNKYDQTYYGNAYNKRIAILEEQLEKYYGLITAFKLME